MIDPAVLLARVVELGFLFLVFGFCRSAIDFMIERRKRIKRRRRWHADKIGWRLLLFIILIVLTEYRF